ncbi:hypothetical protein LAZ67_11001852, partial [Cordylochernes scorpioides]
MPPKRSAIGRSTHQAKRRREYRASETSEQRQARQESNRVHTAHARSLETSGESQARQGRDRVHTAHARSLETSEESQARQGRERVRTALARSLETSEESQARQGRDRVRTALARSLETSEESQARQGRERVRTALARSLETSEESQARQGRDRVRTALARSLETSEESQARQGRERVRTAFARSLETSEESQARQGRDRVRTALARSLETSEESQARQGRDRVRTALARSLETSGESQARQGRDRVRTALARSLETSEESQARQGRDRVHTSLARSLETSEESQARQGRDQVRTALARSLETSEESQARQGRDRVRRTQTRRSMHTDLNLCGFIYNPYYNYSLHPSVIIGKMDRKCTYCGAQKFKNETPGMCCAGGKVKLPDLRSPPEPLLTLVSGAKGQSKHFLKSIRKYNSCFQMISFGATNIVSANYMPTFKVQGQIYYHAGSLLPLPNDEHKYFQIYFMGNTDEQINRRCQLNVSTKREIVAELQNMFEQHNELIKLFKTAFEQMPSDDYKVIIKADKTPIGQHAPTIDEVAIVIVGEEFNSRDIILHRRNGGVQKVSETHRSYDALQYPILFWQGEDGYHFNINMRNPTTNVDINKKITPSRIDEIISAEIPDIEIDKDLHDIVSKNMIHGPCGSLNNNSPCMSDGKCTKRYPRDLLAETITGNDGYPLYRRRSIEDGGKSFKLKVLNTIDVDNRWVVPYSPLLLKTYNAHINVEFCNSVKAIKYICKYVNKGSDMAVFGVENTTASNDEVTQYQLGRYISSNEAVWRIFSFSIHERYPTVVHLAVHLENGQRVYFTSENVRARAMSPPPTTLTAFFTLCRNDTFARTLLYSEVPTYFTWNTSTRKFQRRKQGRTVQGHLNLYSTDALGRLYTVHPNNAECFYLRLLLINVRGPTSFQELKTVNGHVCATFREVCQKLELLENDAHWDISLADASNTAHPQQIRTLFSIILTTCFPANPKDLWEKYKDYMSEDILHRMRRINANPNIQFTSNIYNEALILIEDGCLTIANKSLTELGMIAPNRSGIDILDRDIQRETHFDVNELQAFVRINLPKLVLKQRTAYDTIINAISNKSCGLYFLDAPGGTGKTFLISIILATIRSQNNIALALASSGIAATLLDGGRTAHSALKLSLNMQVIETPTCNISKYSGMGKVLSTCQLIIWDECTMAHKKSLEALNRTLKDLRGNEQLFGGALILLAGDFRQTLPVIPRSTPADELNACLKSSVLWRYVKKISLKTNMRVQLQQDESSERFAKQLLDIGNGKMEMDESTHCITLPDNFCHFVKSTDELIAKVFPNLSQNYKNIHW